MTRQSGRFVEFFRNFKNFVLIDVVFPTGTRDFERLLRTYHDVPVVLVLGTKGDRVTAVNRHDIQTQLRVLESAYDREV